LFSFAGLPHAEEMLEETYKNIREVIELYIETLTETEKRELLQRKVVGIQKVKTIA